MHLLKSNMLRISCVLLYLLIKDPAKTTANLLNINKLIIPPTKDTYIIEAQPTEDSSMSDLLWLGYSSLANIQRRRSLLKFLVSASEIPIGSKINGATLKMFLAGATQADSPVDVKVSQIINDSGADNWLQNDLESMTWIRHEQLVITSTHSTVTSVSIERKQFTWDLTQMMQNWFDNPSRTNYFALLIQGDEGLESHLRVFRSKDCSDIVCGVPGSPEDKRPRLEITFLPPPKVNLNLRNSPATQVQLGQSIIYTMSFQYLDGEVSFQSVEIANPLPAGVTYVADSATSSDPTNIVAQPVANNTIRWKFTNEVAVGRTGFVRFQVEPTSDNLSIINHGATISWTYGGFVGDQKSNPVFNPSYDILLPLIHRK